MDPSKTNIGEIFEPTKQLIIPFFQRNYVWEKKEWRPLWDDIKSKAGNPQGGVLHFTGAIVVQQKRSMQNQIPAYEIIDGQQRLTTFQLILCAIRDVCAKIAVEGFSEIADDAKKYILNTGRQAGGDGQFKLLPKRHDYDAFKAIVLDDVRPEKASNIVAAYRYFVGEVQKFVNNDSKKAGALFDAIIRNFGLVSILVDDGDEPEVIFESLNARARPLLQFDLLRNNLFLRARQGEDEDRDVLYQKYWDRFESGGWVQTAAKEQPTELFLQHFLVAKLGVNKVTPLFDNYQRYRKEARLKTAGAELREFDKCAKHYEAIAGMADASGDAHLTQKSKNHLRAFNDIILTPVRPLFLYLITESRLSPGQLEHVLWACESYVVRSILCKQYRTHFNVFFAKVIYYLLGKDMNLPLKDFSVSAILMRLNESRSPTDKWPSDEDKRFQSALYGSGGWSERNANDVRDVRYILYRMENYLRQQDRFAEEDNASFSFQSLELEHILPRNWRKNWLLPSSPKPVRYEDIISFDYKKEHADWGKICPAEGEEDIALKDMSYVGALEIARERDALLHSLGNLTLLTKPMNASVSDSTFSKKKEELKNHSVLFLNKNVCCCEDWDISQIKERTKKLRDIFRKIWPDAQWFLDNIPGE